MASKPFTVNTGQHIKVLSNPCAAGSKIIGGGYELTVSITAPVILASYPNSATNVWTVDVANNLGLSVTGNVFSVCLPS